jgi:hypothetical protein
MIDPNLGEQTFAIRPHCDKPGDFLAVFKIDGYFRVEFSVQCQCDEVPILSKYNTATICRAILVPSSLVCLFADAVEYWPNSAEDIRIEASHERHF